MFFVSFLFLQNAPNLMKDALSYLSFHGPHREAFTEDDWKLVQLVLTLFRNILAVQEISLQQKVGGISSQCLSLRDRFLELLFHENVMDLILVITQHFGGPDGYLRYDNLLLLEIFHYILMGQEPELIAKTHLKGPKVVMLHLFLAYFLIAIIICPKLAKNLDKQVDGKWN